MPPVHVAAYGIVAFTSLSTTEGYQRFVDVCTAMQSSLISTSDAKGVPSELQMITFWPIVKSKGAFANINKCNYMVNNYDLKSSLDAINDAGRQNGIIAKRRGPFLIAWSPATSRARPDAAVLVMDMSEISTLENFQSVFKAWRQRIVEDPKLWRDGFSLKRITLTMQDLTERYGQSLLPSLSND